MEVRHASLASVHVISLRVRGLTRMGEQSVLDAKRLAEQNGGLYLTAETQDELKDVVRENARLRDSDGVREALDARGLVDQRGDGGFEAAHILRPRLAVIAVLDQRELEVGTAEKIDQVERVAPWHVRIAHALQDAYRAVEVKQSLADEM